MVAWPALDRGLARSVTLPSVSAGEAACFACADNAATGICEGCGSYTCPGCEAQWFGESLCLTCLHARREVAAAPRFRHRALQHDNIALMLLVLPMVFIPVYGIFFAILASPVALFLVIRHWKSPRGLPPRGPLRLILAGALAGVLLLLSLGGVAALVVSIVELNRRVEARNAATETNGVFKFDTPEPASPESGADVPPAGEQEP